MPQLSKKLPETAVRCKAKFALEFSWVPVRIDSCAYSPVCLRLPSCLQPCL